MPDEPNKQPEGNPPQDSGGGSDSAAPTFARKEDLEALSNTINSRLEQIASRFDALAVGPQSSPARVEEPKEPARTVTKEDIRAAEAEGETAKAQALRDTFVEETLKINEFHTNQRLRQLEQTGTSLIASQARKMAENDQSMPYFKRFEKEIDTTLNTLDPASRGNFDVIRAVYDNVVGKHYKELMEEEREAWARQQASGEGGGIAPGGGGPGRSQDGKSGEKLSIDTVFGSDAPAVKARLRELKGGMDSFLQKRGYKDEQEWLQAVKASREEEVAT